MPSLRDQLVALKKEIADADERVEEQLARIETLAQDGHDTQSALDLLAALEQGVRALRECQSNIEEQISRKLSD